LRTKISKIGIGRARKVTTPSRAVPRCYTFRISPLPRVDQFENDSGCPAKSFALNEKLADQLQDAFIEGKKAGIYDKDIKSNSPLPGIEHGDRENKNVTDRQFASVLKNKTLTTELESIFKDGRKKSEENGAITSSMSSRIQEFLKVDK
jgi:hypothetical protein